MDNNRANSQDIGNAADQQICLSGVSPVASLRFEPLDRRYMYAHIVGNVLLYLVIMGFLLLLLLADLPMVCVASECGVLLAAAVNVSILPKAYSFKGFALRDADISYRSGIIFPKTTTIPFAKMQQVSVRQNPVTRFFGLYSIELVNGSQLLSSMSIPGLTEETAGRIKDIVTDKLRNEYE